MKTDSRLKAANGPVQRAAILVGRTNPKNSKRSKQKMKSVLFGAVLVSTITIVTGGISYAQAPTDPQIAGIVQTANQIDIDQAKLALKNSNNPQVKEFANQ